MRKLLSSPLIVIGAARSGTNMLRDVLTQLPGHGSWPCDEINYIWRHGNRTKPSDELSPEDATPRVREYIRGCFERIATSERINTVVEKTCANSLRVGFVDAVLPEARYVFIYRDGRDVVASAVKRWGAPFEPNYILAKAQYVPTSDLLYYASRYAVSRIHRVFSSENRLAFWGPQFAGIHEALHTHSLQEVVAMQWARSVTSSLDGFVNVDSDRVIKVGYEQVVRDPENEMQRIVRFLGVDVPLHSMSEFIRNVSPRSIGKWRSDLDPAAMMSIMPHIEPALARLGYV